MELHLEQEAAGSSSGTSPEWVELWDSCVHTGRGGGSCNGAVPVTLALCSATSWFLHHCQTSWRTRILLPLHSWAQLLRQPPRLLLSLGGRGGVCAAASGGASALTLVHQFSGLVVGSLSQTPALLYWFRATGRKKVLQKIRVTLDQNLLSISAGDGEQLPAVLITPVQSCVGVSSADSWT